MSLTLVDFDTPNANGLSRLPIDVNDDARNLNVPLGHIEWNRAKSDRCFHDLLDLATENTLVRPGHPDIRYKRRAARQHSFVRCRNMRMCAANRSGSPIKKSAHQLFVTGRFCMKVTETHHHIFRDLLQHPLGRLVRTIDRTHEDAPHQTEHRHFHSIGSFDDRPASPRRIARVIGRLDDVIFFLEDRNDFLLAVDVIAQGDTVDSRSNQFSIDRRIDT